MTGKLPTPYSSQIRQKGRVVLSAVVFIVGLWAYLTVVEISGPANAAPRHSEIRSTEFSADEPASSAQATGTSYDCYSFRYNFSLPPAG